MTATRPSPLTLAAILLGVALLAGCSGGGGGASVKGTTTSQAPTTPAPAIDPSGRGPYQVGYQQVALVGAAAAAGGTAPTASVWYPADAGTTGTPARYDVMGFPVDPFAPMLDAPPAADGRFPLVLFSHGHGGLRIQSTFLTEALASHGFVVVAIDHMADSMLGSLTGSRSFTDEQLRTRRVQEARAVVDAMLATDDAGTAPWSGHVDHAHIGLTGHSLGGFTALGGAVGTNELAGSLPGDPRITAVVAYAPGPAYAFDPRTLGRMTVPLLVMTGTEDLPIKPGADDIWQQSGSPHKYRVDLAGAGHNSFTILCQADRYLTDPAVPGNIRALLRSSGATSCGATAPSMPDEQAQRITIRDTVAFLTEHLSGDRRYAGRLADGDGATVFDNDRPPPTTTVPPSIADEAPQPVPPAGATPAPVLD